MQYPPASRAGPPPHYCIPFVPAHLRQCLDCDFRLGRVPARDWSPGSKRPVVKFRAEYPRTGSSNILCRVLIFSVAFF